jgi:hypothetical protein
MEGPVSKKKSKRPRQQSFDAPGMQPEYHKDVSDAGAELRDAKDEVKDASDARQKKEASLIAAMKKHKLTKYVDRGLGIRIEIDSTDKVKLRPIKEKDPDLS